MWLDADDEPLSSGRTGTHDGLFYRPCTILSVGGRAVLRRRA